MSVVHNWRKGRADYSRNRLGNGPLATTANRVISLLTQGGFKFSIAGGYAVQHHGYPRFTEDVDVLVTDVQGVVDYLCMRGFKLAPGTTRILYDRETRIGVDILPSGIKLSPESLPLPEPDQEILSLTPLFNNKLSTGRAKDVGDVEELILRNSLPRDFPVDPMVQAAYFRAWDISEKQKGIES